MVALLALCIWVYLFFGHGRFWWSKPELPPAEPTEFPDVDVVIPARDEAQTIGAVVASLLAQDYRGKFRVAVVDDNSTDDTASAANRAGATAANVGDIATPAGITTAAGIPSAAGITTAAGIAAATGVAARDLRVIRGESKPPGWSGKLWALSQGIAATNAPILLFADADIVHDPRHLSSLVSRLLEPRVEMVSEMVRLNCTSTAERALVPAFIYFFQMLYPFAKVNDPRSTVAAAAGGTVLIRRATLDRIGGIEAIKNALIDDVTLAKAVKAVGPVFLGHSALATSIREYPRFTDIWHMVSRTAFTQLRYSALLLLLTLVGLTLVWLVPIWAAVFGHGWPRAFGALAFALAAVSYLPTLGRYRRNRLWSLALPLIALFYMAATLGSAFNYWFGTGASWKARTYGSGE